MPALGAGFLIGIALAAAVASTTKTRTFSLPKVTTNTSARGNGYRGATFVYRIDWKDRKGNWQV